jgi:hypothetical protein
MYEIHVDALPHDDQGKMDVHAQVYLPGDAVAFPEVVFGLGPIVLEVDLAAAPARMLRDLLVELAERL